MGVWASQYSFGFYPAVIRGPGASAQEMVKLGALQDLTGATSDVGKDEALG